MATINLKLNIKRPGVEGIGDKITFTKVANANDYLRIPRRYPFVDIANYNNLKAVGYFRHATTAVSTDLGGSATTNTEGKLGFQLPPTEKLILLVKKGSTAAEQFTIKGSIQYSIDDVEVTVPAGAVGDLYEVDLYNFGEYITGIVGEAGVMIEVLSPTLEFALIARMG